MMFDLKKSVGILLPAIRISFALVLLTSCLILTADFLGFIPNESKFLLDERKKVSEALAVQFTIFAPGQEPEKIERMLGHIVKHNPEIETAGIRLRNGQLIFQVGDHTRKWGGYSRQESTSTHLIVPVFQQGEVWGNIEVKFNPLPVESAAAFYMQSIFKMGSFIVIIGFFVYLFFMLRALRLLDPSSVVPDRVNAAFDTLTEGIIIIDEQEQIVLANKAFTEKLALPAASLLGMKLSTLHWKRASLLQPDEQDDFPWQKVLKTGKRFIGSQLALAPGDNKYFRFNINASPIQSGKAVTQGVLITLDDVTELEKSYSDLQVTVNQLEESKALIEQKNKELDFWATRDSLTGCLNRRAFNEQFEKAFKEARQNKLPLSFIMTDIDYFKKVNDNYGHATGDAVIKLFADLLMSNVRKVDLVGRYGGEEFSIALPGLTIEEAKVVAERIRLRLKDESAAQYENGPRVTASFGIASLEDKPPNPEAMQSFADEALYDAKEAGRNRVMRWQPNPDTQAHATNAAPADQQDEIDNRTYEQAERAAKLQLRVKELESIASQFSAELEYTKHYDTITGLPNHILFYDRINQIIERGGRHDQLAAILVVDIGEINQISATFGRSSGDRLLTEIAERLRNTFRKYDAISRLTISRFGGDEFAVLLTDLATRETVTWIVMRLQDALSEKIDIDGNSIFITSHVGISLYPADASNVDDLIKNAMLAKKYSKQSQVKNHYQFFDEHMQTLSIKQVNLDKELREAIANEDWLLLYQPKMDIQSKAIVGVEALIRWRHPVKGVLSPYEFIDFAEQRGLIVPIGDWVIKTACLQIKAWMAEGLDCKISVNISAIQLRQENFVDKVFDLLASTGVPPRQLELEVTESTLMNNFDAVFQALKRLNSRGMKIAIDDFGTGYSSLGYLKNLPINVLKIDRIFIKDICHDNNDKQIVKALISMAHSLNMKVVAEGVEEQAQLDILAGYACDEIQGYLLSKPVSVEETSQLLISSRATAAKKPISALN